MKTTRRTPTGVRAEPRELQPIVVDVQRWPRYVPRASYTCFICNRPQLGAPAWRHCLSDQFACASHAVYSRGDA